MPEHAPEAARVQVSDPFFIEPSPEIAHTRTQVNHEYGAQVRDVPSYSGVFSGSGRPISFITICRSFHVSFFWRGSRRRKAGWYVTASLVPRKSYQRPRSSDKGALIASRDFAATAPRATSALGRIASICRIRKGEQVSHSSRSGVRLPGGRHLMMLAM